MGDSPLTADRAPYGGVAGAAQPVEDVAEVSVPAWLAARRSRPQSVINESEGNATETETEVEFAAFSDDASEVVHDGERVATNETGVGESTLGDVGTVEGEVGSVEEETSTPAVLPKAVTDEAPARKVISLPPLPPVPPPLPVSVGSRANSTTWAPPSSRHLSHVERTPLVLPVVVENSPAESDLKVRSLREWLVTAAAKKTPIGVALSGWLALWIQQYSSAITGILFSFGVHVIALTSLAVIVIGGQSVHRALDIFGAMADPNESAVSDIVLDSSMPLDPGKDAAALEFPDMTQLISDNTMSFDPGDSLRGAVGGTGKASGEGGEGEAMSVPPVNVPKYAVTKGSFSAWTEPRDPEPGRLYVIIIHVRLPSNAKSYRGSDLTGMVIGTDLYKQAIKFRADETFPVQDGTVQIRIPVPGAAKLVRDTIRIESKLLREKQTLQIEF